MTSGPKTVVVRLHDDHAGPLSSRDLLVQYTTQLKLPAEYKNDVTL